MANKILQTFVVLFIAIHGSFGKHFRGGSMSWKLIPGNKVELKYRVSYKFNHVETRFDPCTVEAARDGTVLHTPGKLKCDGCVSGQEERDLDYICTDYDLEQDWSIGNYVVEYDVPPGRSTFSISYESCCWIKVKSPDRGGGSRSWNMETDINVAPRPDGKINSSPVAAAIPIEKFSLGCTYQLRIAVSDPDNDRVKCAYMKPDECTNENANVRACGIPTSGLTINKDCSMTFNAAVAGEGAHAVNVMIRDCPNAKCKTPYSKVPLLFLLNVTGSSGECVKPSIIIPPSCKTIPPNEPFEMVIMAEAGDASNPIGKISTTEIPSGMDVSPMRPVSGSPTRKAITLSWTPTTDDIGEHMPCFSALDSDGFTSGRYCTSIRVSDEDPLRPDPETSTPGRGDTHLTEDEWVIRFNNEIRRPTKNAYIRILDATGSVAATVNAKSNAVTFSGNTIRFTPSRDEIPFLAAPTPYTVAFDEGVALPTAGGCMSEATEWDVNLKDKTGEAILPKQHCESSMLSGPVDPASCDLYMKEKLPDASGGYVLTGNHLCCNCVGPSDTGPPGSLPGPPGSRYM